MEQLILNNEFIIGLICGSVISFIISLIIYFIKKNMKSKRGSDIVSKFVNDYEFDSIDDLRIKFNIFYATIDNKHKKDVNIMWQNTLSDYHEKYKNEN